MNSLCFSGNNKTHKECKVFSCVVGRWQARRLDILDMKPPLVLNVPSKLIEGDVNDWCWQ